MKHVVWRIKFFLSISDKMRNRCITSCASRDAKHQYLAAMAIAAGYVLSRNYRIKVSQYGEFYRVE